MSSLAKKAVSTTTLKIKLSEHIYPLLCREKSEKDFFVSFGVNGFDFALFPDATSSLQNIFLILVLFISSNNLMNSKGNKGREVVSMTEKISYKEMMACFKLSNYKTQEESEETEESKEF